MQESWDRKLEQRAKEPNCSKSPSLPSPSPSERTPGRALPRGGVQRWRRHGRHVAQGADVAMADRIVKIPRNSPGMWLQHVSNFFYSYWISIFWCIHGVSWHIPVSESIHLEGFGFTWVGYLNDNFDPTHSTHYCIHPWSIAHSIMSYIITQFHVYSLYIYIHVI